MLRGLGHCYFGLVSICWAKAVRSLLIITSLLITATAFADAVWTPRTSPKLCDSLSSTAAAGKTVFDGFAKLPSGHELYVKIETPKSTSPTKWVVLMHGHLDSQMTFDTATKELLDEGYGVLRFDWYGYGDSLRHEVEALGSRYRTPRHIRYQDQVSDAFDLIIAAEKQFGIKQAQLIGHSMGGALASALVTRPGILNYVQPRVIALATYVYRVDMFKMEENGWGLLSGFFTGGGMFAAQYEKMVESSSSREFLEFFRETRFGQRLRAELPARDVQRLERQQIATAFAALRGLLSLHLIDQIATIPTEIEFDLGIALEDEVVEKDQILRFDQSLRGRGNVVRKYAIPGSHMAPVQNPGVIRDILLRQ